MNIAWVIKIVRLLVILHLVLSFIYRGLPTVSEIFGALVILVIVDAFSVVRAMGAANLLLLGASGIILLTLSIMGIFIGKIRDGYTHYFFFLTLVIPCAVVYLLASVAETFTGKSR